MFKRKLIVLVALVFAASFAIINKNPVMAEHSDGALAGCQGEFISDQADGGFRLFIEFNDCEDESWNFPRFYTEGELDPNSQVDNILFRELGGDGTVISVPDPTVRGAIQEELVYVGGSAGDAGSPVRTASIVKDAQWSFVVGGDNTDEIDILYADIYQTYSQSDFEALENAPQAETGEGSPTCEESGGLAWLLCGIVNGTIGALNFLYNNFIEPQLQINSIETGDNPLYTTWSAFRTIANSLFVVVFLIIIFSQALSVNIDAYTVKKMIPRLVVAVILVQLSYVFAGILIDIFNILGVGIRGVITTPVRGDGLGGIIEFDGGDAAIGLISLSVGLAGFAATSSLFTLVPILLSGFLALLVGVGTLIFRTVLINLLIVISPIAAVAWVLPNTQDNAKQWWSFFIKLLFMYPLIQGLIGAGELAAHVVAGNDTDPGFYEIIVSFIMLIAPFFLLPYTFKYAGGVIANIGGMMNDRSRGLIDRSRKVAQSRSERKRRQLASKALEQGFNENRKMGIGRLAKTYNKAVGIGVDDPNKTQKGLSFIRGRSGIGQRASSEGLMEARKKIEALQQTGKDGALFEAVLDTGRKLDGREVSEEDKAMAQQIRGDKDMMIAASEFIATKARNPEELNKVREAIRSSNFMPESTKVSAWGGAKFAVKGSNLDQKYTSLDGSMSGANSVAFVDEASRMGTGQLSQQQASFWQQLNDVGSQLERPGGRQAYVSSLISSRGYTQAEAERSVEETERHISLIANKMSSRGITRSQLDDNVQAGSDEDVLVADAANYSSTQAAERIQTFVQNYATQNTSNQRARSGGSQGPSTPPPTGGGSSGDSGGSGTGGGSGGSPGASSGGGGSRGRSSSGPLTPPPTEGGSSGGSGGSGSSGGSGGSPGASSGGGGSVNSGGSGGGTSSSVRSQPNTTIPRPTASSANRTSASTADRVSVPQQEPASSAPPENTSQSTQPSAEPNRTPPPPQETTPPQGTTPSPSGYQVQQEESGLYTSRQWGADNTNSEQSPAPGETINPNDESNPNDET